MDESLVTDEIIPPNGLDTKNKAIPIETILEYASRGLSVREIAKLCGCSHSNVHQRLTTIGFDKTDLKNFKNNRADIFAFLQSKLLNSLTDEDIKKLNVYQRVIATGILYDKERLERGQSTHILDVAKSEEEIRQIDLEIAELEKQM